LSDVGADILTVFIDVDEFFERLDDVDVVPEIDDDVF
jgi:hypothetical protein